MTRRLPRLLVQTAVHVAALLPLFILVFDYFTGRLEPNPAQTLEQRTGLLAITLLVATLLIGPLAGLTRQPVIARARRPLGLYTFFVVAVHLLMLVGFDYSFNIPLLLKSYHGKPFIWFGLVTGLLLASLALTSFNWWKLRLGKWWKRLHRLIYLAAILDLAHFFLGVKGNLFTLSGNLTRPLIYSAVVLFLLLLRIPAINRFISRRTSDPTHDPG